MRSTQITTHSQDARDRLLQQYKGKPKVEALLDNLGNTQIQEMENALFQLFGRLNIDLSEGVQLDNIGDIVGQPRSGQSDNIYRLFLKAKIGVNVSESDIPRVLDIWKLITQANIIQLLEVFPAEVDLYYDVPLDSSLISLAFDLIQNVVGAGIAVGALVVFQSGKSFGFDGNSDVLGFGSGLSQGSNTSVSANKLIDSGATFITDGVDNTMLVYNTNDDTEANIISVDSETQLTLDADIFTSSPKGYYINENIGGELAYLQAAA